MSASSRFVLYVKAGKDGKSLGDCPFCHRCYMLAKLKVPSNQLEIQCVNTYDKPESFLKLYPEGKVPVLLDRANQNKVIPDSGEINKYIDEQFPEVDVRQSYGGPAVQATAGVFGKFAAMLRNKDPEKDGSMQRDLVEELRKINDHLSSSERAGKYFLCDSLCEIDCMILPRLRHIQVAGKQYKKFDIPTEMSALLEYIKSGESTDEFKSTCPPDEEIVYGWGKHL